MENIIKRTSTRNYLETELSPSEQETVKNIIHNKITSLFGHIFEVKLVDQKFMKKNKVKRVGTYGVISGKPSFVFAGIENDSKSYVDYGFVLEKIVLQLTSKDIQTCWLGGSFSRKILFRLYSLPKALMIPAVISIGKKSLNKNFVQNLMGNNYHNRKAFETMFFEEFTLHPLLQDKAGVFKEPLEGMRLAPSAMNVQPWRAVKVGNQIHFFCETTGMNQMRYVDMGIGLSHFDYIREKNGLEGRWETLEIASPKKMKYIISFSAT